MKKTIVKNPARFFGNFVFLIIFLTLPPVACAGEVISVWSGKPPGDFPAKKSETVKDAHISNVSVPTLEFFEPPADKKNGATVLICPGGGYSVLAYEKEGTEIARRLNEIGVTGVVLKYRIPTPARTARGVIPLQDAQRALSLLRAQAAERGLDPARIGIMGFSAGGHLAALASTSPERTYPPADEADAFSCVPNFTLLIYPAYMTKGELLDTARLPVNAKTPPAFLAHASDDPITVNSSLFYFAALRKNKVPAELHVYAGGGHGYGLRPPAHPAATWPACAAEWLKTSGFLTPAKAVAGK